MSPQSHPLPPVFAKCLNTVAELNDYKYGNGLDFEDAKVVEKENNAAAGADSSTPADVPSPPPAAALRETQSKKKDTKAGNSARARARAAAPLRIEPNPPQSNGDDWD